MLCWTCVIAFLGGRPRSMDNCLVATWLILLRHMPQKITTIDIVMENGTGVLLGICAGNKKKTEAFIDER